MGAKIVLILVAMSVMFIAAISSAAPLSIPNTCNVLLEAEKFAVTGHTLSDIYQNASGEILTLSTVTPHSYGELKGEEVIAIRFGHEVSEGFAFRYSKDRVALEKLAVEIFDTTYRQLVTPIRSNSLHPLFTTERRARLFKTGDIDLLMIEGFKPVTAMTTQAREQLIAAFMARPYSNIDFKTYGQESKRMVINKRGETLLISRSNHTNNIAANRPGAIPIEYVSFKVAKSVNQNEAIDLATSRSARDTKAVAELEPVLMSTVLETLNRAGFRPTYRPAAQRKSYLFSSPNGKDSLLAIEHIQHADAMNESMIDDVIRAFLKR